MFLMQIIDEVPFIKPTSSWIEKYANTRIQTHSSIHVAMYTPRKLIKSCGRVMTSKEIQGEIENRETKSYKKSSHKSE